MVKILIMDDEPGIRHIMYSIVKPLGYPVFTAEDGHQAIEIGKKEIPNLALLDMRVPDMDGLEVLAELRKINPNIKCIMVSGFGDVQTAVDTIKKGAFEYVSKPFNIEDLRAVIKKALAVIVPGGAVPAPSAVPPPPRPPVPVPSRTVRPDPVPVPAPAAPAAVPAAAPEPPAAGPKRVRIPQIFPPWKKLRPSLLLLLSALILIASIVLRRYLEAR